MKKNFKVFLLLLVLALLSRLVLIGFGYMVNGHWSSNWVHWDSQYYLEIATKGYDTGFPLQLPDDSLCNRGTGYCQRNFAFFPLYPAAIGGLSRISGLSPAVSGVVISNLAFALAAAMLYVLTKKIFNSKTALGAYMLLLVFPFGYIFSAVMTESLFLLLLITGIYLALEKKYLLAGLMGALLSATRNTGVLFGFSLLLIMLAQNRYHLISVLKDWRKVVALLLVPLGLVLFMVFLNYRVQDPLAFINIQKYWEKPVLGLNPLFAVPFSFVDYRLEGNIRIHLFNLAVLIALAGIFFATIKKKLLPFSISSILLWILVPLTAGTMLALPRYVSVLFPVDILFGVLAAKKAKLGYLILAVSLIALFFLTFQYLKGSWLTV